MFKRYPEQNRARTGFAVVGAIFLVFGLLMALIGSGIGALIGTFGVLFCCFPLCAVAKEVFESLKKFFRKSPCLGASRETSYALRLELLQSWR